MVCASPCQFGCLLHSSTIRELKPTVQLSRRRKKTEGFREDVAVKFRQSRPEPYLEVSSLPKIATLTKTQGVHIANETSSCRGITQIIEIIRQK
jgi:hypothetical protein